MSKRKKWLVRFAIIALAVPLLAYSCEQIWRWCAPWQECVGNYTDTSCVIEDCNKVLLRVVPNSEGERILPVKLEDISPYAIQALIASEDSGFKTHSGVNFLSVFRACWQNVRHGRRVSGASTITMQVVRLLEPHRRNLTGKIHEILRARQIEEIYTKKEILEYYFTYATWGNQLRGIEAASLFWFGKRSKKLTPAESAMLIAMLPAPSKRNPSKNFKLLKHHRNRILKRMTDFKMITPLECTAWQASNLNAKKNLWPWLAPHACDNAIMAKPNQKHIQLDIDVILQNRIRDLIFERNKAGQDGVAVVVLDKQKQGETICMLGSDDWRKKPYNAAFAARSAGSTLKPLLFHAAFQAGHGNTKTILNDKPKQWGNYKPINFDETYTGKIRADEALALSRNLPAVDLLNTYGTENFKKNLLSYGLIKSINKEINLEVALGSISITPMSLAKAYHKFANDPTTKEVQNAMKLIPLDPNNPSTKNISWKTGTSSGRRDAWCIAITNKHIICVWLGMLNNTSNANLVGARAPRKLLAEITTLL